MFILSLVLALACMEQEKRPYHVPQPKGWATETIALPPGFAPTMTWKGEEELRFAPGWMKADADTFFSYGIFMWLPGNQKVDQATLEKELLTYYRGLATTVLQGKQQKADVSAFALSLKEYAAASRPSGEKVIAYKGEMKWIEPFTTGKPQTLKLVIHIWYSEKHKAHCIFLCASPQAEDATVWKVLKEIRTGCHCP
jgi:hypothetical protein